MNQTSCFSLPALLVHRTPPSMKTPFPPPPKNVIPRNEISFLDRRGLFPRQSLFPTQGILRGLDYMGTTVFALSGTVTAGQTGMDLLGNSLLPFTVVLRDGVQYPLSHRAG